MHTSAASVKLEGCKSVLRVFMTCHCINQLSLMNSMKFGGSCINRSGAYCFTGVCLSLCLSAEHLTCELNIFLLLPYYLSYNAHIQYAGSFQQYPTSEGHIIKVKVEYQGYLSKKMAVLGALVFHKHILLSF